MYAQYMPEPDETQCSRRNIFKIGVAVGILTGKPIFRISKHNKELIEKATAKINELDELDVFLANLSNAKIVLDTSTKTGIELVAV